MRKKNKTIAIRCTEGESRRIHETAKRYGLRLNDFIMRCALGKKIVVANGIDEIVRQQKAIGRNLNQIAMLSHECRLHSVRLDELIEQHQTATTALCEIAKAVK